MVDMVPNGHAGPEWPADKVERRALLSLVPSARNARTHSDEQVRQIAASIRQWGFTVPVLVDEAGVIIAGHGRVMAADHLGLVEVPVVIARGWSDEQKRAYLIADNQLALNASWNQALLGLEVSDLKELGFEIGLMGFSAEELEKMLADGRPEDFRAVGEDIETDHQCPKCGYVWSGSTRVAKDAKEAGDGGEA
jgi:ParB-like chromosome segregation protein Spo0J